MSQNLQDIFDTKSPHAFREHNKKPHKHTEETRERLREIQLGKKLSKETRDKMSKSAQTRRDPWANGKTPAQSKILVTPWGEFDSIQKFYAWGRVNGLPNVIKNLRKARKLLPDQFYIKDAE